MLDKNKKRTLLRVYQDAVPIENNLINTGGMETEKNTSIYAQNFCTVKKQW